MNSFNSKYNKSVMYLRLLWSRVYCTIWLWLRPAVKWVLRRTTNLCELQRICYGTVAGAERTVGVEFSLNQSKSLDIKRCCRYLDDKAAAQQLRSDAIHYAVYAVVRVKDINTKIHCKFPSQLSSSIGSIWGYKQLIAQVEALRVTRCTTVVGGVGGSAQGVGGSNRSVGGSAQGVGGNTRGGVGVGGGDSNLGMGVGGETEEEEKLQAQLNEKLLELWGALMPDTTLTGRITKQWQEIGFQGDDPCTDFRGMGRLGLENLLYFATTYTSAARHALSRSHHPSYGYSFAIVGINLTHLAYTLLRDGAFKPHFYNIAVKDVKEAVLAGKAASLATMPEMHHFHQLYCYVFLEFDALWRNERPRNLMEFTRVRDKFEARLRKQLNDNSVVLKTGVVLENV